MTDGATGVAAAHAPPDAFALGGVAPGRVLRPADARELAAMVAELGRAGEALVPVGRGAHRTLGHAPRRYDAALSTERLTRVSEHTPADMTVQVEAGLAFADLQVLLASAGQWLPLDPPLPAATTVGGLVAADLGGALVGSQGRVRDYVIGIGVVTADGVRARGGGRVVKNVAGYDLMKLVIGSLGTLAVVTDVTFKVRPLPEDERLLVVPCGGLEAACALGAAIATAPGAVLAATVVADTGPGAAAAVVVRLGGLAADVRAARARLGLLAAAHGAEPARDEPYRGDDAAVARVRDAVRSEAADVVVRMAALPARASALFADVVAAGASARGSSWWHPGHGGLGCALASEAPAALLARLAACAARHDAHLVVERWPPALADSIEVWQPLPSAWPLMRRMKEALDPRGTLAPGRFVGRL